MDKILGIGNALVDIMTKLPNDDILGKFSLAKGSMQLSEIDFVYEIEQATKEMEKFQASGGSAANTIHGAAKLGIQTGYIGKVGNDKVGEFFSNDMMANNIKPSLLKSERASGRAIALVTPDSERTFATYLGAAVELCADDLTPEMFEGYKYLHIEGYLVQNHELITRAAELAKDAGMKISVDMASFNVVEANLDFLNKYVEKYVDIVFANEEEAKSFTSQEPEDALHTFAEQCEIAIVKIGSKGSLIKKDDKVYRVAAIQSNPVDTTGAGDLYASGFLYGLVNGLELDRCGEIGSLVAGNVIEVIGAKMDDERWNIIKSQL